MSFSVYALFEATVSTQLSLADVFRTVVVPGYSYFDGPLKAAISPPGESGSSVRCAYYAESYFRVFVSDLAAEFYREASPPDWIAVADEAIRAALLAAPRFELRRWVRTEEGWDDDDRHFVRVLDEGSQPEELAAALAVLNAGARV